MAEIVDPKAGGAVAADAAAEKAAAIANAVLDVGVNVEPLEAEERQWWLDQPFTKRYLKGLVDQFNLINQGILTLVEEGVAPSSEVRLLTAGGERRALRYALELAGVKVDG